MKITALALALVITSVMKADIETGIRAYNTGDYATAHKEFSTAADAKTPQGLHLLASLYYQGHGVPKDLKRAVELFTEAAELGYRPSQANLGLMYHNGNGVERNIGKALEYYTAAGRQGDLQSAFNLGQIYRKGDGVPVDHEKAFAYYKFAALRGNRPAANELGLMFAQGQSVEMDYVEAYAWIRQSSDAKDPQAMKNLEQLKKLLGARLPEAEAKAKEIAALIEKTIGG